MDAEEREVLNRVTRRLEWDKHHFSSSILITVQPRREVILRGSVARPIHKQQGGRS